MAKLLQLCGNKHFKRAGIGMRLNFLVTLLVLGFLGLSAYGAPVTNSATCGPDSALDDIHRNIAYHHKSAQTMSKIMNENLSLLRVVRKSAERAAFISSSLITLSLAFLMAIIVFKILTWPGLFRERFVEMRNSTHRLIAGGFSVTAGLIVIMSSVLFIGQSSENVSDVVRDYRKLIRMESVDIPVVSDRNSLVQFQQFLLVLHSNIGRLPRLYHVNSNELPNDHRWWTFGWDEVYRVDFEIVAVQALLDRYSVEKEGTKLALPKIKKLCKKSLMI
jgi:hypothetical protein